MRTFDEIRSMAEKIANEVTITAKGTSVYQNGEYLGDCITENFSTEDDAIAAEVIAREAMTEAVFRTIMMLDTDND